VERVEFHCRWWEGGLAAARWRGMEERKVVGRVGSKEGHPSASYTSWLFTRGLIREHYMWRGHADGPPAQQHC
jgi:hypothetical protein